MLKSVVAHMQEGSTLGNRYGGRELWIDKAAYGRGAWSRRGMRPLMWRIMAGPLSAIAHERHNGDDHEGEHENGDAPRGDAACWVYP